MCGPLVRITLSCKGMVDYKVRGGCELRTGEWHRILCSAVEAANERCSRRGALRRMFLIRDDMHATEEDCIVKEAGGGPEIGDVRCGPTTTP
jgi:hypothetical protein